MQANLTHSFVEALKPPVTGQTDCWDRKAPGFGIRVSLGGAKTWVVMYRRNGRKRRLLLGRWPGMRLADARQKARRYLGDVANGNDPAADRAQAKAAASFEELAALYLERHARLNKSPRSVREDEQMLRADLLPAWRDRRLSEIGRKDVIALLDGIVSRSAPIHANRVRALVSKMFNFALARALTENNPAYQVPRPAPERSRDRVLTADEMRSLWGALSNEPAKVQALFKLGFLTAARRSEILGMRWDEMDFATGWWTIPTERSKNGLAHRVPLVRSALDLLSELREVTGDRDHVFPGGRVGRPVENPQKWLRRIRERAGVADFRLHDIRRTVASNLTAMGIPRLTVSKLLNHVESSITAVYDRHSYDAEKKSALLKWDRRLREIVTGEASRKVIELAR